MLINKPYRNYTIEDAINNRKYATDDYSKYIRIVNKISKNSDTNYIIRVDSFEDCGTTIITKHENPTRIKDAKEKDDLYLNLLDIIPA